MRTATVNPATLRRLRGKRTREVIAHELRQRGHATDAKAIWRWENRRNQPSARVLPDLASVLGARSVEELYMADDDEDESEQVATSLDDYLRLRIRQILREETLAVEGKS